MSWQSDAISAVLQPSGRLHLQHGPIDLLIEVEAGSEADRDQAYRVACARFDGLLEGIVAELPQLSRALSSATEHGVSGGPSRRMIAASRPFAAAHFLTPMIAVAGAVADEMLDAMTAAVPLTRAYVNNGGDIALHLAPGARYEVAISRDDGLRLGMLSVQAGTGVGGIASSGARGRSLSMGIADQVTVIARDAAAADAAATLIANAVDLPGHPGIERTPADELAPDSDLGARRVVTSVPPLSGADCAAALLRGQALAEAMQAAGHIRGAALFLQGRACLTGPGFETSSATREIDNDG